LASRPGGSETSIRDSGWSPSPRVTDRPNDAGLEPARESDGAAEKVGANVPDRSQPWSILTLLDEVAVCPAQEVKAPLTAASPHPGGLTSGARAPPRSATRTRLTGTCGLSVNVAVSCPVAGSALMRPTSRTEMSYLGASATRKIRYSSPDCGSPLSG
jgi:hypothetical protein